MMRARWSLLLAIAFAVLVPRSARADDAEEEAAAAYDRGASAFDRQDFATAASELARADELAPNDVTLELALSAVIKTEDAILGMTLVDRAEKRSTPSQRLTTSAEAAKKRFAMKTGTIKVVCSEGPPCTVQIDEKAVSPNRPTIVPTGRHHVSILRANAPHAQTHDVIVDGGKSLELVASTFSRDGLEMDGRLPAGEREASAGISPIWFWVGAGATVALGGATALSALDTASTYDDFSADRSNADVSNDGKSAERRTVILGAVTGVLAVTTVVLGVAFVDWKHRNVAVGPGAMRILF